MRKWVKDELTNTGILMNLNKNCQQYLKQIQDEILQRLQPSMTSCLQVAEKLKGLLRSKLMFNNPISVLGF